MTWEYIKIGKKEMLEVMAGRGGGDDRPIYLVFVFWLNCRIIPTGSIPGFLTPDNNLIRIMP